MNRMEEKRKRKKRKAAENIIKWKIEDCIPVRVKIVL